MYNRNNMLQEFEGAGHRINHFAKTRGEFYVS